MNVVAPPIDFFSAERFADPFAAHQHPLTTARVPPVPGTVITLMLSYLLVAEATPRSREISNDFSAILSGMRSSDSDVALPIRSAGNPVS